MSGEATLRTIHTVAVVPIVVLFSLSLVAAYALGDTNRIPMHWNTNWEPSMYAPKLIGLSIIPVLSVIVIGSSLYPSHKKTERQRIRDVISSGLLLVACHIFHLYLIKSWFSTLST
jgi:uncharacterized membrane protein